MLETVFDIFSAWNALLYLAGGGIVSGIGLLIVGYTAYVRFTERSYTGQIIGVRTDAPGEKMYRPLIAYTDDTGVRYEVLANAGSSLIGGRTPGKKVAIFADSANPKAVMLKRDWWLLLVFGLIFVAAGSPFLAVGFAMLHWTRGTALVALGLAGYLGWKLFNLIHPLLDARKAGGWAEARAAFAARMKGEKHTVVVSATEIATITAAQNKQTAYALPILMLVGAGLLVGGALWFRSTTTFMATALSADGVVLSNEESDTSDSESSYHAVVEFTDRGGNRVIYQDGVGSSPPLHSTGDKVRVFYAPENSSSAMIDRGIWNWLVPALMACVGGLMFAFSAWSFISRRDPSEPAPLPQ